MSGRGWWHLAGRGGVGAVPAAAPAGPLLPRGTLAFGLDPAADRAEGALPLDLGSGAPWHERLTLSRRDGGVTLRHRVGAAVCDLRLGPLRPAQGGSLRLTLTWDAPLRRLRMTAEDPPSGRMRQVESTGAMPVGLATLAPILSGRPLPAGLSMVAVSDREEPVGPRPGLPPEARLTTPGGPVPIAAIRPGMQVLTRDRGFQPVIWQGPAALPLAGPDRPVRLFAPYFGLDRDLVVSPDLRLLLGGPGAEYLFGEDEVLVAARHLTDGHRAVTAAPAVTVLHQVLFERHEAILASGLWVESLCAGTLADAPGLLDSTVLAGLPQEGVPRHRAAVRRTLRPFEAAAFLASGGPTRVRRAA